MLSLFSTKQTCINTPAGDIQTRVADNFFNRFKGLLGTKHLPARQGLLIKRCNAIHTLGMQYAIDAVFLDTDYKVIKINADIKPGKAAACKGARHTLELAAGQAAQLCLKKNMILLMD